MALEDSYLDSSSSSSGEEEQEFIPYETRSEWEDVKPIYLDNQETQLVNIVYSDEFKSAYAYLRACLSQDERSERALRLTEHCIRLNPANYTVWYYRRVLLKHLKKDFSQELRFLGGHFEFLVIFSFFKRIFELTHMLFFLHSDYIMRDNQKNYQVWQHRKCLIEQLNDQIHEKDFTLKMISMDSKNYHAWQHRQWVVNKFKLWDGEISFVNDLLYQDVRNNSAWNHRYFVLKNSGQLGGSSKEEEVLKQEVDFGLEKIKLAPGNESSWNYLRGILKFRSLTYYENVIETIEHLLASECKSPHLLGFKIDCICEKMKEKPNSNMREEALQLCDQLSKNLDPIRKEYWKFIASEIASKFA